MTVDDLTQAARELQPEQRAALVDDLLGSLEPAEPAEPAEAESAWEAETGRRAGEVLAGKDQGHAWAEVRARMGNRLAKQR